jgi:hypothetical protein
VVKKVRLKSGFTLGGEQAEADPLLEEAFFRSSDYEVMESKYDPRCFVVGRTGSGKSAALQHLQEAHDSRVIRINPEDLSLPYIAEQQVFRYLADLEVNLDLFWIALWKHVLLVEIIRHRYKVNSPAAKQKMMDLLREKLSRDPGKRAALDYLDEFEGRFWCETDERVREIADKFTSSIGAEASAGGGSGLPFSGKLHSGREESHEVRAEQAERFQRVVNKTQLAKLNKMLEVLNEQVLDDQHYTYVVIDDLDRDWVDERLAKDLIRCLFRTVLDLKRVANLKVLVALRTNLLEELDYGRRSSGQEEKFRSLILTVRWTRADLETLLDQRVAVAGARVNLESDTLEELLPHANKSRNPTTYILDRTLLRPRDAIAFVNECLALGIGRTRLTWDEITKAESAYSLKRLLALRDEWSSTYPGINQVLGKFRASAARLTREELAGILDEIMLLLTEPGFPGVRWLTDLSSRMWAPGDASWFELYQPLTSLLFQIGFLGATLPGSAGAVFYMDEPLLMELESNINGASAFFVHRTYHMALDIRRGGPGPGMERSNE